MGKFSDDLAKRLRGKSEDKDLARQAVERDRQQFAETIADAAAAAGQPHVAQPGPSREGAPDVISIEIAARDNLTPDAAMAKGGQWRELAAQHPNAHFIPSVAGYDDDPRELWDFPGVCEYMQRWAAVAGIGAIDDMPSVDPSIIYLFAACGVFGPAIEAEARAEAREKFGSNPTEQ